MRFVRLAGSSPRSRSGLPLTSPEPLEHPSAHRGSECLCDPCPSYRIAHASSCRSSLAANNQQRQTNRRLCAVAAVEWGGGIMSRKIGSQDQIARSAIGAIRSQRSDSRKPGQKCRRLCQPLGASEDQPLEFESAEQAAAAECAEEAEACTPANRSSKNCIAAPNLRQLRKTARHKPHCLLETDGQSCCNVEKKECWLICALGPRTDHPRQCECCCGKKSKGCAWTVSCSSSSSPSRKLS